MPIPITWDNEARTVLYIEFQMPWTWADYDAAIDHLHRLIQQTDHTVDIISYMAAGTVLPPGSPMDHLRRAMQKQPANAGVTAFIGDNQFGEAIIASFSKIYKNLRDHILVAPTVADARQQLTELRRPSVE
jgi:hypothetical protein